MGKKNEFALDVVSLRLVKDAPLYSDHPFRSPADVVSVLGDMLSEFDREILCLVNLKADLKPINVNFVSVGSLTSSLAHPREILKSCILSNAVGMLLVHNHPSGNLFPSKADVELTDRLNKLTELLGIQLYDHMIVGGDNTQFFSFLEKGMIDNPNIQYKTDYRDITFRNPVVEKGRGR